MSKVSGLLILLLVAALAFQSWQTMEVRKEVRVLSRQIAAEHQKASARVSAQDLKDARSMLEQAAKAAGKGDQALARQLSRDAYLLMDPSAKIAFDAAPLLKELEGAKSFLQNQLKGVYTPSGSKQRQ